MSGAIPTVYAVYLTLDIKIHIIPILPILAVLPLWYDNYWLVVT